MEGTAGLDFGSELLIEGLDSLAIQNAEPNQLERRNP
jgi:hypothetical protein